MKALTQHLIYLFLITAVTSYDCYDQRCYGAAKGEDPVTRYEDASELYIECDQASHYCAMNGTGYPLCVSGTPGTGVNCSEQWAVCAAYHGKAACIEGSPKKKTNPALIWGPLVGLIVALLAFAGGSWYYREWKRDREADDLSPVVMNIHLEHAEASTSGLELNQVSVAPPEVGVVQIQVAEKLPGETENVRTEIVEESPPEIVNQPENVETFEDVEIFDDDNESIDIDNSMELADKI